LSRKPTIRHTLTPPPRVHSDSSAINALYNIICQEKELLDKMSSVTRKPTNGKASDAPKTNGTVGGKSQARSRSTSRTNDQSSPVENGKGVAAQTKEERLARYKEERRKQQGLAPQQPQQQQPEGSKSNGNPKR
jgi:hypothetical protein